MAIDTALDVISLALRKIKVLGIGDTLEAEEAQESLDTLNMLIETLSVERAAIFEEKLTGFNFQNGNPTYTIGPGGDFQYPTRPTKLWSAYTRLQSIDYPIQILTDATQYDAIINKYINVAYPASVWYEQTFPLGTLHFFPAPTGGEVYLRFWDTLQSFPTLTTQVALPIGYKRMLILNLALELSLDFGREPSAVLVNEARKAKAAIKRFNQKTLYQTVEAAYMSRDNSNRYNIMSDSYT